MVDETTTTTLHPVPESIGGVIVQDPQKFIKERTPKPDRLTITCGVTFEHDGDPMEGQKLIHDAILTNPDDEQPDGPRRLKIPEGVWTPLDKGRVTVCGSVLIATAPIFKSQLGKTPDQRAQEYASRLLISLGDEDPTKAIYLLPGAAWFTFFEPNTTILLRAADGAGTLTINQTTYPA